MIDVKFEFVYAVEISAGGFCFVESVDFAFG